MIRKTYNIEVDCASCANKVEEAIRQFNDVSSVKVDFMQLKMNIDFYDNADVDETEREIRKRCLKIEPDFEMKAR